MCVHCSAGAIQEQELTFYIYGIKVQVIYPDRSGRQTGETNASRLGSPYSLSCRIALASSTHISFEIRFAHDLTSSFVFTLSLAYLALDVFAFRF